MVIYIIDFFLFFLNFILIMLMVLLSVAFLTLLERKVLGYIQIRKGPNKVGYWGILQPFGDAIKLFSKEQVLPHISNYMLYYFSPVFSLFLALFIWLVFPYVTFFCSLDLGFLFILCVMSLGVYGLMIAGWSSNSNYSLLGSLRSVAQTISYEVSLSIIMLSVFILSGCYNMGIFIYYDIWFVIICFPLFLCFYCSCLAETNRTPFDFAEGEFELVSGFNVEYGGVSFALIFLAEYAMIIFMSFMIVLFFFGGDYDSLFFFLKMSFISFSFLWVRGTLPRYRYDKLMYLAWSGFLPVALNYLFFFFGLKILFFIF
uniref:NADH-ubiquinone oxidoreductase chain 1 n=1 Tax=Tetrix japonica TaxID=215053 RepID=B6CZ34_9ORTH|nr:NADH dehydrogenase subunit 1 [Tetrix japonica]ACC62215.1 NADH dehydrogenase subunit 1 [Tetrix japonica]AFA36681.1 NADH dehydrogenase subunit 1 [Tetrix japonica]